MNFSQTNKFLCDYGFLIRREGQTLQAGLVPFQVFSAGIFQGRDLVVSQQSCRWNERCKKDVQTFQVFSRNLENSGNSQKSKN